MPWTKEQECAINATGASLLVSAAAGSGKTSVLVERLIRQLSDTKNKIPADKMIIVTFTKDAASEMKQRLTTALSQLIEKNPENSWLSRQQLLLQSAKISTIHSFCFDLIRDNIQELELSPGFRIMDETEAGLMLNRAISDLVTKYYEKFPEKIEKLYDRFCYKDDSAIERLVADIYNFISSIPFGEKWLGECCERYKNHGDGVEKELLLEQGIADTDAFLSLTNLDEENILLSLFAQSVGCKKTITKINRIDFDGVVQKLDLNSTIYPKHITSDIIVSYVRATKNTIGSNVETLYSVIKGKVEAAEFIIKENSPVAGKTILELNLKKNVLIAAILRDRKILTPRGSDIIQPGDSVVIVSKLLGMQDISDILTD